MRDNIQRELSGSPSVLATFSAAYSTVSSHLSPRSLAAWSRDGVTIYRRGPHAKDATEEYFKASMSLVESLSARGFLRWARLGAEMSEDSCAIAASFFRASPLMGPSLTFTTLDQWAEMGRNLYREVGTDGSLTSRFFEYSPRLVKGSSFHDAAQLSVLLALLGKWSNDLAVDILNLAATIFEKVDGPYLSGFLDTADLLASTNLASIRHFFDVGTLAYTQMEGDHRDEFLDSVVNLSRWAPRNLATYLSLVARTPALFIGRQAGMMARISSKIAVLSLPASREFLKTAPSLIEKLDTAMLESWGQRGLDLLADQEAAGINYFRLESKEALEYIQSLTPAVELQDVREVLRLYCQALMGKSMVVLASEELAEKGPGWALVEQIPYQGSAIFAPSRMGEYATKEANFEGYKVLTTHQAAHLEFNTFDFSFYKDGAIIRSLRPRLAEALGKDKDYPVDFDRYFDLFTARRLARELFTITEDTRTDHRVKTEYRGIRGAFRRSQDNAVSKRPPLGELNLREAMVETLMRLSLDESAPFPIPNPYAPLMMTAAGILNLMTDDESTVEDATEVAIRLYVLMCQVPNITQQTIPKDQWSLVDLSGAEYQLENEDLDALVAAFLAANQGLEDQEEMDYAGIPPVGHRGDLRPEVVQTLLRLQSEAHLKGMENEGQASQNQSMKLIIEALEELLASLDVYDNEGAIYGEEAEAGDFTVSTYIMGILRMLKGGPDLHGPVSAMTNLGEGEVHTFRYDEWDFRAKAYRPQWCQVRQRVLQQSEGGFYEQAVHSYQWLVNGVRRQFEMLRPEHLGKDKRRLDGEEFDLDAVVESVVERSMGNTPNDKIYWRRRKMERNVAVAVLLDMSLSTDERIEHLNRSTQEGEESLGRSPKRIIDIEKQSLVLFVEALEQIRDTYGIYGFSGSGKEDVQFYIIKDTNEPFSDAVARRIDKITPVQGTRMGPAIRHTIRKLEREEAKTKILILLSDGRPQDRDYGGLPYNLDLLPASLQRLVDSSGGLSSEYFTLEEREYAVHDTKMALNEAKARNIVPFCLSVDREGHDYLKVMCGDIGYEMVSDIEALPRRLVSLYRRLTT
ncbi:MAG: hypothetical protein HW403_942 [Dehalococcoidia bacterium]|nr:hypothetical protein [Dehalococcoidia bacterium]